MPYITKWVQVLPPIGLNCPVCDDEFIEKGQYGGVICRSCKTAFKISQYPAKQTEAEIQKENKDFDVFDMADEIKLIKGNLNTIEVALIGIKTDLTEIKSTFQEMREAYQKLAEK